MPHDPEAHPTRFRVAPDVHASVSTDGLVILDVRGGLVLASNTIGARIWELIERQVDCRDIAAQLARDFGVPVDRTERDVRAFVTALEARGLVSAEPTC